MNPEGVLPPEPLSDKQVAEELLEIERKAVENLAGKD